MTPRFFKSSALFRKWLEENHANTSELLVGFHKKSSGKASITYPEALDEALCFGWIDGVRKSVDENSYVIRFSPRKAKSIWSNVNTRRATELKKLGLMKPAGLAAFAARDDKRSGIYSFENRPSKFGEAQGKKFRSNEKAWEFFAAQPPSYRRTVTFWVMNAKKEETQSRRLEKLIEASQQRERLGEVTGGSKER